MAHWEADHSSPTMKGMQQSTVFPWFIVPLLFDISLILPLNCNILIDEHKIENMKYFNRAYNKKWQFKIAGTFKSITMYI